MPIWEDIRNVTKESVRAKGIHSIDLISGGWPCQPVSIAGKRRGKNDDRFLWPEMLRIIDKLRPRAVIGENVDGFVNMVQYESLPPVDTEGNAIGEIGDIYHRVGRYILREAVEALEAIGYEVGPPIILPACCVDAPHRRYRVFIMAYAQERENDGRGCRKNMVETKKGGKGIDAAFNSGGQDVADTHEQGLEIGGSVGGGIQQEQSPPERSSQDVADAQEFTQREPADKTNAFADGRETWEIVGGRSEYVENAAVGNDRTKIECDKTYRAHPGRPTGGISGSGWWSTQPGLGGVFDGLSARLDQCRWPAGPTEPQYSWEPPRIAQGVKNRKERLKAIGNAVNPYQVFPVLYFMAQIIRRINRLKEVLK